MREVGHIAAVKIAVARMVDGFVKGMGTDPDAGPAQVVLADIDRVQCGVPSLAAGRQDVFIGNRIAVQRILSHIALPMDNTLHQFIIFMVRLHREEDVFIGFGVFPKCGNQGRFVGIADVVFAAVGHIAPFLQRCKGHLGVVQISTVRFFRKAKGKDATFI